jgi:DNA-binding Lrp family transcriptional regulator
MLHQFINNELYTIEGVSQAEFYFIKEIHKRYERFFEREPFATSLLKLKKTDWILIEELAKDGRANPGDLADKLGIHVTTVYRRMSALLKENIIKISGVPNPSRLAYSANAYIILDVDQAEVGHVCDSLYSYHEVHFIMTMGNRSGVIVCIHTIDNETLYEFLKKKIAHLKGLSNTETFIRAMVQKTYYGWLIEPTENAGNDIRRPHEFK